MPRTAIASEVWGINFDSETNTVDVAIRRLRAKVDDPFEKEAHYDRPGDGLSITGGNVAEWLSYQ